MKVWIVNWDCIGGDEFDGVFSTEEKAMEYARLEIEKRLRQSRASNDIYGYENRLELTRRLSELHRYIQEHELDSNLIELMAQK